ncbi:MAG TPA: aldo/keto reductase [Candidatus Dormibacteraeota bacterium]|nr:aldo/keto reductase [Candidatus Dormibacteraeota bacterium]
MSDLPIRVLGSTGVEVTALGMGGEGVLRTFGYADEAAAVIERALAEGITYLESARAYSGSESYYGATLGARREGIFLASKAHERSRAGALAQLETTLRALRADHLDLWQLHDVREWREVDSFEEPGGAYAAFAEAKERGLVRFIGVTGHHDPAVLRACVERFRFDTVLLPVNPAEAARDAFAREVIPAARLRGMGVIGMKVFARGLLLEPRLGLTVSELVRYALSHDVDTIVVGYDDPAQVSAAASAARAFSPMAGPERAQLERRVAALAARLTYYRRPEPVR